MRPCAMGGHDGAMRMRRMGMRALFSEERAVGGRGAKVKKTLKNKAVVRCDTNTRPRPAIAWPAPRCCDRASVHELIAITAQHRTP